ncbi:MAG TPA: glycoside hydrolase family 3 N-terminal domain-containing protein [Gemmatimonadaceae bacterium]|nr:glycoside hydrolase family 3 N-terminal domain-containing protein [Gemmatimonadaceae bacterium]
MRDSIRLFCAMAIAGGTAAQAQNPTPALPQPSTAPPARTSALNSPRATQFADSILALMTLEEKLGQLSQSPAIGTQTGPHVPSGGEAAIRAGKLGSFLGIFGAQYTHDLQRIATTESRLKIPLLFAWDIIHGLRTIYPIPLAEAASFDPARAEFSARQAAVEATAHGLHWTFAPMVDLARDPRWGRISEGAGEDPFLGAAMAAARVRGFQGGDGAVNLGNSNTMMATAKHFAAYGGAEGGRDYNTVELSERTLWEFYLPPYEAAVKAGAATIMSSFNDIGGRPAHASDWLLGDVLRGRWGFQGMVVSDWGGIGELTKHGVAATTGEAGVLALRAGVDVDMADNIYVDSLPAAVRAGRLSEALVDSAVRRILRMKYVFGLFEDPYRFTNVEQEKRYTLAPEHLMASRMAGREGVVLLKNDSSTLPLRKDLKTIAVIGPLADDSRSALGNWAGDGRREEAVNALQGIKNAVGQATRVLYVRGAPVDSADTTGFTAARSATTAADAIVLVLGEREDMSGEASSRASIELPGAQLALARAVLSAARASATGSAKPVVVVLMNGRPLAIPELAAQMPAIVESWFLGSQHGNALADVLFGDYNPGGKLPATFPRATGQIPTYYNHRNTGRPADPAEHYTSKYLDLDWNPLFPFGYGLSYTKFNYSNLRLSSTRISAMDSLEVSVDVGNIGDRIGEEVVQLYIRDEVSSVSQPVRALKGFKRVTIQPGRSATVSFKLGSDAFALYDQQMRRVVEPGFFSIFVGTNSRDTMSSRVEITGDTLILAPATPRFR